MAWKLPMCGCFSLLHTMTAHTPVPTLIGILVKVKVLMLIWECGHSNVIHLDSIICCTHLIPVYGWPFLPSGLTSSNSLNVFSSHYVSKYADHQMFEILG